MPNASAIDIIDIIVECAKAKVQRIIDMPVDWRSLVLEEMNDMMEPPEANLVHLFLRRSLARRCA